MIGIAALLLLWLEPAVTAVGLVVLALGLVLHAVTRRRPPVDPALAGGGGRFTQPERERQPR